MSRDSIGHTFLIATLLCGVCSLLVSATAVGLRPRQQANKELEKKRNVLLVSGAIDPQKRTDRQTIERLFGQIDARVIDLSNGQYVDDVNGMPPEQYDQRKATKDPKLSDPVEGGDIARIKRRERYSAVYLVEENGDLEQIILPVYGSGLWSTLYGFVSLEADATTVRGLVFYEHGETPGLGGEVDNVRWRSLWKKKKVHNAEGQVAIEVIKGTVTGGTSNAHHKVDGLSGATLTANGVTNLIRYWLGNDGFGPFLDRIRAGGAEDG